MLYALPLILALTGCCTLGYDKDRQQFECGILKVGLANERQAN